ncbi:MAG: VPLPA-CTERM sorting domain-containing protein [Paracoccaceae bacterium]
MKIAALTIALGLSFATQSFAATIQASFWDTDTPVFDLQDAVDFADNNTADATFDSLEIDYPHSSGLAISSFLTLTDFVGPLESPSIIGDGSATLDNSILRFSGTLNLAPGTYNFDVTTDDGFILRLGNTLVSQQDPATGLTTTSVSETVTGPTEFELYYVENRGRAGITFSVDGTPVNDSIVLAPVSLPASMPLALAGIGIFGFGALRRKAKR